MCLFALDVSEGMLKDVTYLFSSLTESDTYLRCKNDKLFSYLTRRVKASRPILWLPGN